MNTIIRQAIKKSRKERKLTRHQLAELSGVPARTICSIERGERDGRPETIEKILNALGLKIIVCSDSPTRGQKATG